MLNIFLKSVRNTPDIFLLSLYFVQPTSGVLPVLPDTLRRTTDKS